MNVSISLEILKANSANIPRSRTPFKQILSAWDVSGENVISFLRNKLVSLDLKVEDAEASRVILKPPPSWVGKKSVKEKAYQRAFYNSRKSILKRAVTSLDIEVTWLDFEMPVSKKPKLKFDLIGQNDGDLILAELKGPGGESPFYALWEALRYARYIEKSRQRWGLPYRKSAGDYWRSDKALKHLIVAGPAEGYWGKSALDGNSWWGHRNKLKQVTTELKKISECQFDIIFAHFPDEDFAAQAAISEGHYEPYCRTPVIWHELPD